MQEHSKSERQSAVRGRTAPVRSGMGPKRRSAASVLGSVRAKRILAVVLCFLTAFFIAGTQAFPGTYPFGIALAASAGGTLSALSVTLGAMIGSARIPTVGGVHAAVVLALFAARAAVSVWVAGGEEKKPSRRASPAMRSLLGHLKRLLLEEDGGIGAASPDAASVSPPGGSRVFGTVLRENVRIRLALSALAALFAGAWSVVAGGYEPYDLFGAVFSLCAAPLCTYLFYAATERKMRSSPVREFGVYALLAVVTLSLHGISESVFSLPAGGFLTGVTGEGAILRRRTVFDAGIVFAFVSAVAVTVTAGVHRGALTGILCGVTMTPAYAPMYALAAVICAVLGNLPAGFSAAGAAAASVTWAIFVGGLDGFASVTPPVILASAVLVPLLRYELIRIPPALFGTEAAAGERSGAATAAELSAGDMRRRIHSLGEGLASVSAVLGGMAERLSKPSRPELRGIVEEAFGRYCGRCGQRASCRNPKADRTDALRQVMTEALSRDGAVSAAAVPSSLASRCGSMGTILDEVNRAAGDRIAALSRRNSLAASASDWALAGELFRTAEESGQAVSEVDEALSKKLRRILSYNNFGAAAVTAYGTRRHEIFVYDVDLRATRMGGDDIRRLFESVVGQPLSHPEFELNGTVLSMRLHSVNAYACRTGSFSCAASSVQRYCGGKRSCGADSGEKRSGDGGVAEEAFRVDVSDSEPEGISGDSFTDFEADGRYYMILSDGMGSGKEAALTSGMAVSLLERLIRAGAELETALRMLNQIVRSTERECSATVDIAEIDLATGAARFIKSGAAPSFVLRGGSIFRLQSKTVPLGILRALDAEMIRFDVQAGDTVVMVSDGAARSYEEAPWLLDLMSSDEGILSGDERAAAMTVVSEAAIRGARDDITCGILRVRSSA